MRKACHVLVLLIALPMAAQGGATSPKAQNDDFQRAYDLYHSDDLQGAAAQLEALVKRSPGRFEVHELLGLTYARAGQNKKATGELRAAVLLQPDSVPAHNNLATSLMQGGLAAEAEQQWKEAVALQPSDFSAIRNLAKLYLQQGEVGKALPLLVSAHDLQPAARDVTCDLAQAEILSNHLPEAHAHIAVLQQEADSGEVHNLLGQVAEKEGAYVEAANQYSTAAHLAPNEDNLFSWGSELLLHRAYEPAIAVFQDAARRFPESARLWVGLGMSQYSRGEYEDAVHALLKAADLNAADPRCYFFLSKAYLSSPDQAEAVIQRFRTYADLKPRDARAQFYYAMSLWKGRRMNVAEIDYKAVEALLQRSLGLDDTEAETHLQLGILYNDQHAYEKALPQLQRAIALQPELADAHFRLGRLYLREGDHAKADVELDRFKQLQARHQAQVDKERAEVQQFVLATGTGTVNRP